MRLADVIVVLGVVAATPSAALAQRFPFDRSFDINGPLVLDVQTIRGKIDVTPGPPGRVVVSGAATVRLGWNSPNNAVELARGVADHPPIEQAAGAIRLRPPADAAARQATTVNYEVRVPPNTEVITVSDSGATTVHGVSGRVVVRTQSGAIEVGRLGGAAEVTTGSGAVTVEEVEGALTVTTASGGFFGRGLAGGAHVRTASGGVDASFAGNGRIDVETRSSAIRLRQVTGPVTAVTGSGHVSVQGMPGGTWSTTTGSGSVDIEVDRKGSFTVDAISRSGSVRLDGAVVQGEVSKRKISGNVEGGGSLIRVTTRSGSIAISVEPDDARTGL